MLLMCASLNVKLGLGQGRLGVDAAQRFERTDGSIRGRSDLRQNGRRNREPVEIEMTLVGEGYRATPTCRVVTIFVQPGYAWK